MSIGTLLAVILGAVPLVVAGHHLARAIGTRRIAIRLDKLQTHLSTWQVEHQNRINGLEHRMCEVERSVARAEDDAHRATQLMRQLARHTVRRLEEVEQRSEVELLVAQGRIPREHRRGASPEW